MCVHVCVLPPLIVKSTYGEEILSIMLTTKQHSLAGEPCVKMKADNHKRFTQNGPHFETTYNETTTRRHDDT